MAECPCGSEVKPGLKQIQYITQGMLDSLVLLHTTKVLQFLNPAYAKAVDIEELCSGPPPDAREATIEWYLNPIGVLDDIFTNVVRWNYNSWCQCKACPPITGCTGDNYNVVNPSDGHIHDEAALQYRYLIPGSQTIYVERVHDGQCFGPFQGLDAYWITNPSFDPNLGISICNSNYTGCQSWSGVTHPGGTLKIYYGSGSGGAYTGEFELPAEEAEDPPMRLTCDDTNICTALEPVYDALNRLEIMSTISSYHVAGVGGQYTFNLPGVNQAITGTLNDALPLALQALMPPIPSQLVNPTITPITEPSVVNITSEAYAVIELTTVPDWMNQRGTEAPVYFSSHRSPGPGWVVLESAAGAIGYYPLLYPQGLRLLLPPDCTAILIELTVGVEASVTTYEREIT